MRHCISQPHDAQALIFPVKLYPRHCLPQSHYVSHTVLCYLIVPSWKLTMQSWNLLESLLENRASLASPKPGSHSMWVRDLPWQIWDCMRNDLTRNLLV
jgi:hypothetical protein